MGGMPDHKQGNGVRNRVLILAFFPFLPLFGVVVGNGNVGPRTSQPSVRYYWETQQAGKSAQLVTLFCSPCGDSNLDKETVPLLSVLRDTLGDNRRENDRLTYVWLLSSTHQNVGQRLLAAVPFFYWRAGGGSTQVDENRHVKPLMDLTKPEQPMAVRVMRDILQWTVLDPLSMPVRASTRAYSTNEAAGERGHLEEAIGYLRQAPKSETGDGLTEAESDTLVARLALRERLLGGLVRARDAQRVGEHEEADQEVVRSRNWDLLRSFAEKTGLTFESLNISGTSGEYGLLWFPADKGAAEPVGASHSAVWKALNLQDPWTDSRLRTWEGPFFERSVDSNGSLLPSGADGSRTVRLIPLGAYGLNYPKFPLLLVDFRDKLHVRRNEMTQRSINELTSGVIGISHFTNWYYYAGASAYDFVASRQGRGMDAASRLDCYSQFRLALALDNGMDPKLRTLLQRRIDSVALNPLEGSPQHEVQVAEARYNALLNEASSGELEKQLGKTRAAELAQFGKTQQARTAQAFLSTVSFTLASPHYAGNEDVSSELDRTRRIQADLDLLHAAAKVGPNPEIAYDTDRMRTAVQELSQLLPGVRSQNVRKDAASTVARLVDLTKDRELLADCSALLATIRPSGGNHAIGIAAAPKAIAAAE
jgi:hypothetical protein